MTLCKHIRRPASMPDGGWWIIRCDCSWEGRTPDMGRPATVIDASLEQIFRAHLPEGEAKTHLLVDARPNPDWQELDWWLGRSGLDEVAARAEFANQPAIIGTFVMPFGEPVLLLSERVDDDVHFGTYRTSDGDEAELPVGEVRTPEGRVFRLDQ